MDRRSFLQLAGGTAAGVAATSIGLGATPAGARPRQPAPLGQGGAVPPAPFTLGVASGDPVPDGVVLWTRLAPDPLVPGGGMPGAPGARPLGGRRRRPVPPGRPAGHRGGPAAARATPSTPRSAGCGPAPPTGTGSGPVGRSARPGAPAPPLRPGHRTRRAAVRASPSCQNYEAGFYTAHRRLAAEDLDFVVFLGDYIYEGTPNPDGAAPARRRRRAVHARRLPGPARPLPVRPRPPGRPRRRSRGSSRSTTTRSTTTGPTTSRRTRRCRPPRRSGPGASPPSRPTGSTCRCAAAPGRPGPTCALFRRATTGATWPASTCSTPASTAPTSRSTSPAPRTRPRRCSARTRRRWLDHGLRHLGRPLERARPADDGGLERPPRRSRGAVRLRQLGRLPRQPAGACSTRLARAGNPVVVTGDRHATWVCDLKTDFADPASPTVGAELTGTSISSGGDPNTATFHATFDPIMAESPHWKFIDNQRGLPRVRPRPRPLVDRPAGRVDGPRHRGLGGHVRLVRHRGRRARRPGRLTRAPDASLASRWSPARSRTLGLTRTPCPLGLDATSGRRGRAGRCSGPSTTGRRPT